MPAQRKAIICVDGQRAQSDVKLRNQVHGISATKHVSFSHWTTLSASHVGRLFLSTTISSRFVPIVPLAFAESLISIDLSLALLRRPSEVRQSENPFSFSEFHSFGSDGFGLEKDRWFGFCVCLFVCFLEI